MSRGANFKIGASSDRHNFRDFDDKFHQPETHLAITNPDYQARDMIVLLGDRAGDLDKSNCRTFQRKIQRQLKDEYRASCKERGTKMAGNAKLVLEANINLEEWHTEDDLRRLADRLEKDLNIEMLYMVAHFDEGHQDKETGEIKINSHAHFKFTPLVDGKITRRDKVWVRKSQDICSEVLGMKRGESVETSGRKGMGHKAYRQSKRAEESQLAELEEIKQEVCNVAGVEDFQEARRLMKESGLAKAADYSELKKWRSLNKTPEELKEFVAEIQSRAKQADQANETEEALLVRKINDTDQDTLDPEYESSEFRKLAMEIKINKIPSSLDDFATKALQHIEKQKNAKLSEVKTEDLITELETRSLPERLADRIKSLWERAKEKPLKLGDALKRLREPDQSVGQEAPQEPQRGDNGITPSSPRRRR